MTTGTTRLHINLSHYPYLYRSSKLVSNKNNNNVRINSLVHETSENLLINCKQKSLVQTQSQSDSEFENVSKPPRSLTLPAGQRKRSISFNPLPHSMITHPYFCDGLSLRGRPRKLLMNGTNQLLSDTSQSCVKSCIQDEELPELSIAERKKLLMKSIPRFHRSITPSESFVSGKKCDLLDKSMQTITDNTVDDIQFRSDEYQAAKVLPTLSDENSEERIVMRKRSTSGDKVKIVHTKQKLSLTRRCSEATLPLTFSLRKHHRNKSIKKPRSNTSDVILDQDKTFSTYPLENQEMSNSQNIDTTKSMSPTKTMFINSRSAMPRHSMYFLPLPLDFNDEETDSLSQLFPTENNECSVESSQNYLSDKTTPLNPCHITSNSILSHCSLTEGSSYGDDVRMKQLINSGDTLSPNRDSNFDINQSENYSNTLDSQDGINLSSSIEDIICRGGDLGDSGCHFDQLTKYFNTPSVKKVILDLSQMKYVGLSLVGGADSPFGNLPVLVKEIMPGGAAERCEIRRGDEIIGINSFSLEDKPLQSAVERLRHCSSRDQEIILWVIEKTD